MPISRTKLLPRTTNVRDARLCVIATEGTVTEKQYFDMFGDSRIRVVVLPTDPQAGDSAPDHVLKRLQEYQATYQLDEEDSLWLMLDVDRWLGRHGLQKVCKNARQIGIRLAISNPCFELWLLLHHQDADPADQDCKQVQTRLRAKLDGYNKSKIKVEQFRLAVSEAIERAKMLDTDPDAIWPPSVGTHVYRVVASLPLPNPSA